MKKGNRYLLRKVTSFTPDKEILEFLCLEVSETSLNLRSCNYDFWTRDKTFWVLKDAVTKVITEITEYLIIEDLGKEKKEI